MPGDAATLQAYIDDDYCYLTTRGRVSGRPHEIEIWFALEGATLYLMSGGRDASDWLKNARKSPDVTVRLRDETYTARARILDAGAEDERVRSLLFEKYRTRYGGDPDGSTARAPAHDPVGPLTHDSTAKTR